MRKRRILKEGATYYVTATANRGEMILGTEELKNSFLNILHRAKAKYKFIFYNFCLFDNRIQFVIKPLKNENLSKIMQWILSVYAKFYNKKYNFKGHVWYDRFRSKIIQGSSNFLRLANLSLKNIMNVTYLCKTQKNNFKLYFLNLLFI